MCYIHVQSHSDPDPRLRSGNETVRYTLNMQIMLSGQDEVDYNGCLNLHASEGLVRYYNNIISS